jgi:2-polyprenyl-6-methoxyphenol hydroxylase-like FAD-dependent oxidoreductase
MDNGPMSRALAVVIGAGIAGLSTAAAVAGRFGKVLVLDRDELPDTATPRRGVPQGYHGHVLLAAGQWALEDLFPGLRDELVATGALPFDPGDELGFFRYGAVWPRVKSGLEIVAMTRPLLELTLRRRVAALPNVTIRPGVAVSGLTGAGSRITGVVLDDGEAVPADLVLDCTGRSMRSDRWLGALGLPTPDVVEVKIGVRYATQLVRREPGELADGIGMLVMPTPPGEKRIGLSLAVEGDRWLVGLGGWHGEYASADLAGFHAYAKSLPEPTIGDLLARAEPVTDIVAFQFPASRRRRFELLREPPGGYLAVGDAICSFNPIYGQGMTVAALEAVALRGLLDRVPDNSGRLARAFYRAAAKAITTPWQFAVGADFLYPETTGPRPRGIGLLNGYSARLQRTAQANPGLRRTFTSVQQLVSPPRVLFTPAVIAKVIRGT